MKSVPLLACITLSVLVGCSNPPEPEDAPEILDVAEFEVFGMDCPGCHGGLENLAREIEGVRTARASWTEKKLTLGLEAGVEVSDAAVRAAVERANFTIGERLK